MYTSDYAVINNNFSVLGGVVVYARPLCEKKATNIFTNPKSGVSVTSTRKAEKSVVLATVNSCNFNVTGKWLIETIAISQIAVLFSFIDNKAHGYTTENLGENYEDNTNPFINNKEVFLSIDGKYNNFMGVLISDILDQKKKRLIPLFSFFRNMESYWISGFLLSQVLNEDKENSSDKLYIRCKEYGLSESYFRKLCYKMFICGPKKQLRAWRAAYSLLQLIESDKTVSTIAINNGYSSSSHFSSEIKSLFGITPKEFKRLEGLFNE